MLDLPIEASDRELIDAASDVLRRNFAVGRHHVGAALRTRDGRVYTGVHVGSRRINICAEEITIGTALSAGERDFVAVASVIMMVPEDEPAVTSPCGVCREVLSFYGPDMTVVYLDHGELRKTRMADLLPGQWLLPGETPP
jgi:cytidine deaminase